MSCLKNTGNFVIIAYIYMTDSIYHSLLRISALTVALVLVFVSGLVDPLTKELTGYTGQYLANTIGMSATVEPTELNTITSELTKMRVDLEAREKALSEREIKAGVDDFRDSDTSTYVLSVILFIILVLIVLNYVLDYVRSRPVVRQG